MNDSWVTEALSYGFEGPPHHAKGELISQYLNTADANVLVETGTATGAMIEAILGELGPDLEKVFTIEMSPEYHKVAKSNLSKYGNVKCLLGNSAAKIVDVLNELKKDDKVVFYLDAHYSGPNTARWKKSDTPILSELHEIFVNRTGNDVIMIDDARLFEGMPFYDERFKDYPKVDFVESLAKLNSYSFDLVLDTMILVGSDVGQS